LSEAAEILSATPGAMTLRVLQTLNDVSNDKMTVVVPLPVELFPHLGQAAANSQPAVESVSPQKSVVPEPAKGSSSETPPLGRLKIADDKILGVCPHCDTQFNVTQALANMRYDRMPDQPGMQLRCAICSEIFTLPEVSK